MPDPVSAIVGGAGLLGSVISSKSSSDAAKTAASSADAAAQLQYQMYQQQREDLAPWREAGAGAINALWGTPAKPEQVTQGAPIYGTPTGAAATQQQQVYGSVPPGYTGEIMPYNPSEPWTGAGGGINTPYYNQQGQVVFPANYGTSALEGVNQIIGYQPSTTTPATAGTTGLIQGGPGEFTESPSYQFALSEGQKGIQRAASATGRLGSGAYLKDATSYAKNLASEEYQNFLNRYYQSLEPYFRIAGLGTSTANTLSSAGQNYANQASGYTAQAGQAQAAGQLGVGNTLANTLNWGGQQYANYNYMNQLQNQNALGNYWQGNSYNPYQMNSMGWL